MAVRLPGGLLMGFKILFFASFAYFVKPFIEVARI